LTKARRPWRVIAPVAWACQYAVYIPACVVADLVLAVAHLFLGYPEVSFAERRRVKLRTRRWFT
jgi:hypothetical protein